jgi:hypothetical protein
MQYNVIFWYTYALYNLNQVKISISSNIYHFFMVKTSQIFYSSILKYTFCTYLIIGWQIITAYVYEVQCDVWL